MKAARTRRVGALLAVAAVGTTFVAACSSPQPSYDGAASILADRVNGSMASYSNVPTTIAEALPTTRYVSAVNLDSGTFSDLVVTGRFTGWQRGVATVWPAGGGDSGTEVDWDDDAADTRTILLTFTVDSTVAAAEGVSAARELTVRVPLDGGVRPGDVGDGLTGAGETVVFLRHPSNPSVARLWSIAGDGGFVGTIDDAGSVTMGVIERADDTSWLSALVPDVDGLTIDALRDDAMHPTTVSFGG